MFVGVVELDGMGCVVMCGAVFFGKDEKGRKKHMPGDSSRDLLRGVSVKNVTRT